MPNIQLLLRGNTKYQEDFKRVHNTLAVTFDQNIDSGAYYLELKREKSDGKFHTKKILGEIKDAKEAYKESKNVPESTRHLHFELNLRSAAKYSYQVKRYDNKPIQIAKAYGEKQTHEHTAIEFRAPLIPNPNEIQQVNMVFYADQEVHQTNKMINRLAHIVDKSLAQPEVTVKIAKAIKKFNPDIVTHGGDMMQGEEDVPGLSKVSTLSEFRRNYEQDFHLTMTDNLGGAVFVRASDDHDDGENGKNKKKIAKDPKAFENSVNARKEFSPVPTCEIDGNRGLCYETVDGNIHQFVLNGRFFNERGSVLGNIQLEWLENAIQNSTSPIKFVVCSLPPAFGKNPKEDLRSAPPELIRFFKILAKGNVALLKVADSHNYAHSTFDIVDGEDIVTIPVIQVGTGGGTPQELTKKERQKLPNALLPKECKDEVKGTLKAYYTAMSYRLPGENKKYRAYQNGQWTGKEISKDQFGMLKMRIRAVENPDTHETEPRLLTSFYATRIKEKENEKETRKKAKFKDKGDYPTTPTRRPRVSI